MNRKTKFFWLFVSILFALLFFKGQYKKEKLLDNKKLHFGHVIKVRAGVATGGGIQFRLHNVETRYNLLMPKSVACESKVKELLPRIRKLRFPAIYDTTNVRNAKILLFKSQYDKYEVEIPDNLSEIIDELSECE